MPSVDARAAGRDAVPVPILSAAWRDVVLRAAARFLQSGTLAWAATSFLACFAANALFSRYLFWDSFLDLTGGRYVAEHGIPRVDTLTIEAAGEPWINQQWLAHWIYYEAWAVGGYPALALLSTTLIALAFALLTALLMRRGVPGQRAVMWSLLAFAVCAGNTVIRAQSFAYPLIVGLIWLLVDDWERQRLRWWFAAFLPVLVLWANVHGSVLLAAALFAGYGAVRAARHVWARHWRRGAGYAAVGGLGALTPFATPYGFSVLGYYETVLGNATMRRFSLEWTPPSLAYTTSIAFFIFVGLVVAAVAYAVGRGFRPSPVAAVVATVFLLLASQAVRNQAWFALAGAVLAAEALARTRPAPPRLPRSVRAAGAGAILVAAVVIGVVVGTTSPSRFETLTPRLAVAAAAEYAAANPGAQILADDWASSALLWRFPATAGRVAYDARLNHYSEDELARWFSFVTVSGPDWFEAARGYDVLVASRTDHPTLAGRLARLHGWRVLHSDADGIVVVRAEAGRS
jgi:hypothetical protein